MMPDTTGDLGSILGVWGHPDDEAWLSSGLMMRAVDAGHRVKCVTATRGEAGFPAGDPRSEAERSAVRESELADCLKILGVTDHQYLGYADGRCADVADEEAVATLVEIINEMRPDTVLSFAPDGATGHPDHIATCRWATRAITESDHRDTRLLYAAKTVRWTEQFFSGVDPSTIYMFADFVPENFDESALDVWFTCDDALVDRKLAAMLAQKSQIEGLANDIGLEVFREVLREEFFRAPRGGDVDLMEQMSHLRLP